MAAATDIAKPAGSRDASLDAIKGIAIVMVVSGHAMLFSSWVLHGGPGLVPSTAIGWVPMAVATNVWFNFIQFVQMPLFALVSGLVLWPPRDRPLGVQVWRRVTSLLVPYVVWLVLYFFVAFQALDLQSEGFGAAMSDGMMGRGGGLWYLYTLFICVVVVLLVQKLPRARLWLGVTAVLAAFLSTGLVTIPNVFALGHVLWIYPFLVLGYLIAPARERVLRHRTLIALVCAVVFAAFFYLQTPALIASAQPIAPVSAWLGRVAVSLSARGVRGGFVLTRIPLLLPYVCGVTSALGIWCLLAGRTGRAVDAIAWVGRKSLGIYVMHFPLVLALVGLGVKNPLVLTVVAMAVTSVATMAVERIPVASDILLGQRAVPLRIKPAEERDSL